MPIRCRPRWTGSSATNASGLNNSIVLPRLWRKNHGQPSHRRHQAKPRPQAPHQRAPRPGLRSLALKRRINAPPAKVYEAWTDPAKLARWFGPRRVESVQAETDVRVGGRYRMVAHSADGEVHEVGGTYREVIANEKLVFTWAWR